MMMDSPFIESSYIWQAAMHLSVVSLPVASMNPQMQRNCAARVIIAFLQYAIDVRSDYLQASRSAHLVQVFCCCSSLV